MKRGYLYLIVIILILTFALSSKTNAQLACYYRGACTGTNTSVLEASDDKNAHAASPGLSSFDYKICCGANNFTATTTCGTRFLGLSDASNGHVEWGNLSNYAVDACIGPTNLIRCTWWSNATCPTDYTCLALMDKDTNSHIAQCNQTGYDYNICCKFNETTAPSSGSITINSGDTYVTTLSVTLTLTYYDAGSGVKDCRYGNGVSNFSSYESCAATKSWTLPSGDGNKTVYFDIRDNALNNATFSDWIIYDITGPDTSIDSYPANPTNSTSANFTFSCTETLSTPCTFSFRIDGAAYSGWTSNTTQNYTGLTAGEQHTFDVIARDAALNQDSSAATYSWNITQCGNSICESTENSNLCPRDCGCISDQVFCPSDNSCVTTSAACAAKGFNTSAHCDGNCTNAVNDTCLCSECASKSGITAKCVTGASCPSAITATDYRCTGCNDGSDCASNTCVDYNNDSTVDSCGFCGGEFATSENDSCDVSCNVAAQNLESISKPTGTGRCDGRGNCLISSSGGLCKGLNTKAEFGTECNTTFVAVKTGENFVCQNCSLVANEGSSCNTYDEIFGECNSANGACQVACASNSDCPDTLPYCNLGVCDFCYVASDPAATCTSKNSGFCDVNTGACIGSNAVISSTELIPSSIPQGGSGILRVFVKNIGVNALTAQVQLNDTNCPVDEAPIGIAASSFPLQPKELKTLEFRIVPTVTKTCSIQVKLVSV